MPFVDEEASHTQIDDQPTDSIPPNPAAAHPGKLSDIYRFVPYRPARAGWSARRRAAGDLPVQGRAQLPRHSRPAT